MRASGAKRLRSCAFGAAALASATVAAAQSTNVAPDLSTGAADFDPAKAPGLAREAKAAYASAAAKLRSGDVKGLILAASPEGDVWTLNVATKRMADYNAADSARQALEICEFQAGKPCAILSVNGYETRRAPGEPPKPQPVLSNRPSDFDATRLPFVPASKRAAAAAYVAAKGPRAFAVTTSGLWLWRSGANAPEAIARTMADCAEAFKPAGCVLYAVGSRVVFGAE